MLVITRDQVERFAEKDRADFLARMASYLRVHYADLLPAGVDLDAWLADGLRTSLRFGVDTEPEVAQLLLLFLVLGIDAPDRLPWVREVLRDRALLPIGKMRKLLALARANEIPAIDEVDVTTTQEIG